MEPKFIIVNNGLTELRGHGYETGVLIGARPRSEASAPPSPLT